MGQQTAGGELEARYERYKTILKDLTIMSDVFMRNVLKKQECTEHVLRVILEQKDLKVLEQVLQKDYKNLQGRSAILDCVAQDANGSRINLEIQQESEGAGPKRARYHSGLLDMNTLNPGQDFEELPRAYVIFITRDDVLGRQLPIYHIERRIRETGEDFQDESHIVYVNASREDDTELGDLMHDFHCKRAKDMRNEVLARRVYELKETQRGIDVMCKEMDEIYREGIEIGEQIGEQRGIEIGEQRGEQRGRMDAKKETALKLAGRGTAVDVIAEVVDVSIGLVREWLNGSMNLAR